jgi:hypothetical protein
MTMAKWSMKQRLKMAQLGVCGSERSNILTSESQTPPSSTFKSLFDAALHDYLQQTGVDLINYRSPDSDKLENCHSPEDIIQLLSERKTEFTDYRDKYRKLIDPLVPVVRVAHMISGVLGAAAGLVSYGRSIALIR